MHGNEKDILDAFAEFNCGAVFSAEVFIWPDVNLAVSNVNSAVLLKTKFMIIILSSVFFFNESCPKLCI